ncbi:MAG: septal ring lytic transglycosylase RlpA family protein [Proteobacteria bacterium]|nr:septal ring lytic transglycosylase RlpA family protein [Pseudomonadota bacterium]
MNKLLISTLIILTLLSACGKKDKYRDINPDKIKRLKPKTEKLSKYGNHSPYRVHGRSYRVNNNATGFTQTGQASWYGKKFHGKKTSNQEIYDMYKLTAAHKTLLLPSYVEVTNLRNNKKVIVRVNDRGPFVGNRIIDLSYAAAKVLDFVDQGITDVKIEVLKSPGDNKNNHISHGSAYIQLGAFSDKNSAKNLAEKISNLLGIKTFITILNTQLGQLHRVRIGPLDSDHRINKLLNEISNSGLSDAKVVTE